MPGTPILTRITSYNILYCEDNGMNENKLKHDVGSMSI